MLLAIDVGNTQTTVALFGADGQMAEHWRMATDRTDTADELHERLHGFFLMYGLTLDQVTDACVASVVPILTRAWERLLTTALGKSPVVVGPDCGGDLRIGMPDPRQLGADRIANAIEAIATYGAPVIVVDFGTATNIDVIDETGTYRGGTIAPGLSLSASALFSRAAKLSSVDICAPAHALGDSTETAVQSGIVIGEAARAEGLVRRIKEELGSPDATVVATGGLAETVAEATDVFDAVDPELTLRGIRLIWQQTCDAEDAS